MTSKLEWMVFLLMTNFIYQSSQEEIMETLKNCSRPPQIEGVAQFIQIGEKWIELNETEQESFEVGTTVSFQCQSPGLEVLEGMPDITCSSGQWPEVHTSCLGVEEKLTITPVNLPRKVQHDGSITVFLPPMTLDRNVTITCQLRRPREPDLLFTHIQQEEGRAVALPERGDSIHPKKYLTLSPANESDSGEFDCTDMDRTNQHPVTIQFENLLVEGCPVNVTKQTDQGMNDTEVCWGLPILHADVIAEITANFNSGDRFQIGVSTVTITAATGSGTFDVCTFHVNIVDKELPRIEGCPGNILTNAEPSQNFAHVTWEEPIVNDNSGEVFITGMNFTEDDNAFLIGETIVTYEARDRYENVNTCNFTVTVRDVEPPRLQCPESQRVVLATDEGTAIIDWPNPNVTDNSGYVNPQQSGADRGRNYPPGIHTINYTVQDGNGNTAKCSFIVEIVDEQPPTIMGCPANKKYIINPSVQESIEATWTVPTVSDNTGSVNIQYSHEPGDTFTPGRHDIYVIATDASNNEETCHFKINVKEGKCVLLHNMSLMWEVSNPGLRIPSRQVCSVMTSNAGLPRAYRNCTFYQRLGGLWSAGAEVTDCGLPRNNVTLQELKDYPVDEFTAEDVALSLSDIVSRLNVTRLDDTDVILIADIIDEIVETRVPSQNILESILATVEMVYLTENEISIAGEKSQVSTRITLALEQQVTTLSKSGMELTIETESIVVRTATVENSSASIGKTAFEIKPVHHSASMPGSSAGIPTVKLPLEEIHRTVNASLTDPIEALHLGFIYYENPVLFVQAEIGARSRNPLLKGNVTGGIISASVGDLTIQGLRQSVEIVFPLNSSENLSSLPAQCVFWDFNLGANGGGWSNKGCWLVEQTNEFIVCHSDHLTHFAVLMDFTGHGGESAALDILTKIGCVLSIAGLLITIITFVAFRTLRNSRHRQILINHCISLLLLYIVFLAGIDSNISFVCMASAILLHYFMLTTMFWMAVEAHNMYMYLVKVFQRDVRRFILKASILAWGVPLLITTASVLSSYEQYKSEEYCFPNPGINLYLSLLLPICLVMVHNFVIFSMVVCRLVFTDVAGKAVTQSRKQQLVTRLQNAMCMSVLMGLSWSLGLLVVAHPTFIFQLLFCIVNSLQGLAVFILFCVRVSDVRTAYKTCMPWLDVELNIRGQSYKVQERSIHHNRGRYLNGDDPLWLVNSDKVVNALSWPSDTPGLEGYMHLQFERQLSSNTDTTRVSSNSFSFQRSNSRFSRT
ncbi:uncharacterized protein [Apostichopus japonicus]|uniref:uncharacterized protein isoform X2 n=1 Tax=Stichopus japonicus TaxID=307972 RepID=UPI003AB35A23